MTISDCHSRQDSMIQRAKITDKYGFKCAPNGYKVESFPFGSIVTGKVAEWAIADKAASAMFDPREEAKVTGPDETKVMPRKSRPRRKKG